MTVESVPRFCKRWVLQAVEGRALFPPYLPNTSYTRRIPMGLLCSQFSLMFPGVSQIRPLFLIRIHRLLLHRSHDSLNFPSSISPGSPDHGQDRLPHLFNTRSPAKVYQELNPWQAKVVSITWLDIICFQGLKPCVLFTFEVVVGLEIFTECSTAAFH